MTRLTVLHDYIYDHLHLDANDMWECYCIHLDASYMWECCPRYQDASTRYTSRCNLLS